MKIKRLKGLKGTISVPGDKSISHRSIMLGSIAEGWRKFTTSFREQTASLPSHAFGKWALILKTTEISSTSMDRDFTD